MAASGLVGWEFGQKASTLSLHRQELEVHPSCPASIPTTLVRQIHFLALIQDT